MTLERSYFPEAGELPGGVALPADLRHLLDRYLGEEAVRRGPSAR